MKFRKKSAAAVALAAVMTCGMLAGCDSLITQDVRKDYEQVVAEVDLRLSDDFKEGGKYASYASALSAAEITKRDLVSTFASQGGSLINSGYSYGAVFQAACDSLVNRQIYLQYAKVYFLSQEASAYTVEGYGQAVDAAAQAAETAGESELRTSLLKDIAGLGYFLDADEKAKAEYSLKSSVNDALDTEEESVIAAEEDDHEHDTTVRTTPTGVNTEEEDYCPESYEIYTGTGERHVAECGEYEPVDGSTVTTRKKAYNNFLNNLRTYSLLYKGEDTSNIESLAYYAMELKNAYESALLNKLADAFEDEAENIIYDGMSEDDWIADQFNKMLAAQIEGYKDDEEAFETALDGMSDSSFVLAAPEANYGFVINILLPFSTTQSAELSGSPIDSGDKKGNKFAQRAAILQEVTATDQRGTWFTGEEDYSFLVGEDGDDTPAYTGSDAAHADARKYLFFGDCLADAEGNTGTEYEPLKNYYGQYTYNGVVTPREEDGHTHYTLKPYKIDIDGFIAEMEGYLKYALGDAAVPAASVTENYFTQTNFYTDNKVDYSKFVYYANKVNFTSFDANELFLAGSEANKAFSVINELSFAYNTDTAGLNSYLGYAVTPHKTDFVPEFEYAAQKACEGGAGTYVVAPSDYGWHIIYCTFSFTAANTQAFTYNKDDRTTEGTFSYLFYESLKAQSASAYATNKQTEIINSYSEACSKVYEERYADLANLG